MISDILRETKHLLPEKCKEIRGQTIPHLRREIDRFEQKIQTEDARFGENRSVLESSNQVYINKINRLFDERKDEFQKKTEAAKQRYVEKRDTLKWKVEYLDMLAASLSTDIEMKPGDYDILNIEKGMRDELEKALSYSVDKYTYTTVFVPGLMNVRALEKMIGEVHSVSLEETNDVDIYSDFIHSLNNVSYTRTVVTVGKDNHAKLIDKDGRELNTMKSRCFDLIISKNEELVLTNSKKCRISVLNKHEKTIRTVSTKPLHPSFIRKTINENILVTLRDGGDAFNLLPTSRRVVQRTTLTGKVLHTYEFREDGKTRLFTLPSRTADNKNTDVCVINLFSKESGELVGLHTDGRVKFTYRGENEKFKPLDVECDETYCILLTEKFSSAIQMLSSEGTYVRTIPVCQYDRIRPIVISIHDDNLWCGFYEGRVKVYKFTNQTQMN